MISKPIARQPIVRLALVALLWLLATSAAQSGGKHWFKMLEDLEGFSRCYLGDYSTLYDFTPFEERSKTFITSRELAELRERWEAERARVALEIERIDTDPMARSRFVSQRKVRKNSFFRDVDYRWVDAAAPLQFVVQDPQKDHDGYHERAVGFYEPWARAILELFQREYVEPLALESRDGAPVYTLAILNSEGAYGNYQRRMQGASLPGVRAHYDPSLRVAITYEPWSNGARTRDERQHSLMHELVHALQHAYTPKSDDLPHQPWLNEGLAEYLSSGTSSDVEELAKHPLDEKAKKYVADLLAQPGYRDAYFFPVAELIRRTSYRDVKIHAYKRSGAVAYDPDFALSLFYRQSYLFVYFLHEGSGGKYREPFFNYLAEYFKGRGRGLRFEREFKDVDLEQLQREFIAWIQPSAKDWAPSVLVEADPAITSGPAAAPVAPEYDAKRVRPDLADPEVSLALAVYETSKGKASAALAYLDEVDVGSIDAAMLARVAEEKERVGYWIDLRDRYLDFLRESGRKLDFKYGGDRHRLEIEAVNSGVVRFSDPPEGMDSVAVSDLDPLQLVQNMIETKDDFEPGRARPYIYILRGDKRGTRLLDKDDEEDQRLRESAEREYPGWVADGRVLAGLLELSEFSEPKGAEQARAVLGEIDRLISLYGDHPAVTAARPGLADLAQLAHIEALRAAPVSELFAGQARDLGEGRVLVSWGFDDPAELEDFAQGTYAVDGAFQPVDDSRSFSISGADLYAIGNGCLRTLAAFGGDLEVAYTMAVPDNAGALSLYLGVHDDGAGNRILADGFSTIVWFDQRQAPGYGAAQMSGSIVVTLDKDFTVKLSVDDKGHCVLSKNGNTQVELAGAKRSEGSVYLGVESQGRMKVSALHVTGTLTPESRLALVLRRAQRLASKIRR